MDYNDKSSKTLYQRIIAAGIPSNYIDSHYSDLYLKVTPETKSIVNDYCREKGLELFGTFISQIEGWRMYDIPFAYDPYWTVADK